MGESERRPRDWRWSVLPASHKRRAGLVVAALVIAVTGVALVSADKASAPLGTPSPRCIEAPRAILAAIGSGLHSGGRFTDGKAVRSADYEHIWFVAAADNGKVGVWATNDLRQPFTVASVDKGARELSDWGADSSDPFKMSDDGAREAQSCV